MATQGMSASLSASHNRGTDAAPRTSVPTPATSVPAPTPSAPAHPFRRRYTKIDLDPLMERVSRRLRTTQYTAIAEEIQRMTRDGELDPVKTSKTNGRTPALFNRYREPVPDFAPPETQREEREEFTWCLTPPISHSYYFNHPERYHAERRYVLQLSDYLKHCADRLARRISLRERCFEIWQFEKCYDEQPFQGESFNARDVLKHCGMTLDDLNVYRTVEPVPAFSLRYSTPQTVLIVENSDTFFSFWSYLSSRPASPASSEPRPVGPTSSTPTTPTLFSTPIDSIVYGSGNKVTALGSHFSEALPAYLRCPANRFLYLGDLDDEGIAIFDALRRGLAGTVSIRPFREGYTAMARKARAMRGRGLLMPRMKERQRSGNIDDFLAVLPDDAHDEVRRTLAEGRYIPQEILSDDDYAAPADAAPTSVPADTTPTLAPNTPTTTPKEAA